MFSMHTFNKYLPRVVQLNQGGGQEGLRDVPASIPPASIPCKRLHTGVF